MSSVSKARLAVVLGLGVATAHRQAEPKFFGS